MGQPWLHLDLQRCGLLRKRLLLPGAMDCNGGENPLKIQNIVLSVAFGNGGKHIRSLVGLVGTKLHACYLLRGTG